jgi:hypothetical protein
VTTSLHGGFDQVFEIGAAYLAEQARRLLVVADASIAIDEPAQKITGKITVGVRDVWLASAAETFSAASGSWQPAAARPRVPQIVVGIGLDSVKSAGTGLLIERITVTVNNSAVTLTIPVASRFLDVHAGVAVRVPVVADRLHTRPTATAAFPSASVPCVSLLLHEFDPARSSARGVIVEVALDEPRLRASPFVTYVAGIAQALHLDPEAVVMTPLRNQLRQQITGVVRDTLHRTADWQVQEPERLLLYSATDPMVTAADVLVDPESLRVLLTVGGLGGDATAISTSLLEVGDSLAVCVNGTSLLRDVLRSVLESIFVGLDDGDFAKGEPCTVAKRVLVTLGSGKDAPEVVLTYLQAGIEEDEDLVLWWQMEVEWALTKVLVEVEVPVTFSVQRVLTATTQALSISTRLGTADHAEFAETWIPGWGQLVQAIVSGGIGGALSNFAPPRPFRQPLPSGTELRVTGYSLHQDDAPRGTRTGPPIHLLGFDFGPDLGLADLTITTGGPIPPQPARWRDHDLVVRLGSRSYPAKLTVGCVIADGSDPGTRIDGIGGTYARGSGTARWSMTAEAAIEYLRGGGTMVVAPDTSSETTVRVVDGNPPYLRTQRDTDASNNLVALPRCPPVVDAPIPDPVGTPSKTIFSDTMVHWRDVIPAGGKGDETVNHGVTVASGCTVTDVMVELIDRNGAVLASAGAGGKAVVQGAGANLVGDITGGRSLSATVHWWFDPYSACRYRVHYTVTGTTC